MSELHPSTIYTITPGIAAYCDVDWEDSNGIKHNIGCIWYATSKKIVDVRENEVNLPFEVMEELFLHFKAQFMLPYHERGKVTPWKVEVPHSRI